MDCEKCMKTCVELRRTDGEILNGHYNILCKMCWGKTYEDGQENDYIKQNEDGEMIGCCEECQSEDEPLTIWDIEHENDLVKMVKELEEDGGWNFVYTNQALCQGCNEDLDAVVEAEYEEMKARQAEEEAEEEQTCGECGRTETECQAQATHVINPITKWVGYKDVMCDDCYYEKYASSEEEEEEEEQQ